MKRVSTQIGTPTQAGQLQTMTLRAASIRQRDKGFGKAVDIANELRKLAAAHGKPFAISEPVTTAAGVDLAIGDKIVLRAPSGAAIAASLSASPPPVSAPPRTRLSKHHAALRRLWSG